MAAVEAIPSLDMLQQFAWILTSLGLKKVLSTAIMDELRVVWIVITHKSMPLYTATDSWAVQEGLTMDAPMASRKIDYLEMVPVVN